MNPLRPTDRLCTTVDAMVLKLVTGNIIIVVRLLDTYAPLTPEEARALGRGLLMHADQADQAANPS